MITQKESDVISAILDRINPNSAESLRALNALGKRLKKYNLNLKTIVLEYLNNNTLSSYDTHENHHSNNTHHQKNDEEIINTPEDFARDFNIQKAQRTNISATITDLDIKDLKDIVDPEIYKKHRFLATIKIKVPSFNKKTKKYEYKEYSEFMSSNPIVIANAFEAYTTKKKINIEIYKNLICTINKRH